MVMKSKAQRRFLWDTNPELAGQFEEATPNGTKLPERKHPIVKTLKRAFTEGTLAALDAYKIAGEEIRLQIPTRAFHGWDAAWRGANRLKKADNFAAPLEAQSHEDDPVERLTAAIQELQDPKGALKIDAVKDPLERDVHWSAPSHTSGHDASDGRVF